MSCIHFKFKSSLEYEKITFDGLHISLADLKEAIMKQKKIGLSNAFELEVVDAQSKKVYEDNTEMLQRNTSVIIRRVPLANAPKLPKTQQKDPSLFPQAATTNVTQQQKLTSEELRKTADLVNADASEEEKVLAMIKQAGEGFDPSQYAMVAPRAAGGVPPGLLKNTPPPNYTCFRCGQRGHWIKLCPTNGDPTYDNYRYKRSLGTPSSQIVTVPGNMPGAMVDRRGNLVVRTVDFNAVQEFRLKNKAEPVGSSKKVEIPPELICHKCKELVKDAVIIPCCGESFCDECIREHLLENDFTCPMCSQTDVSPDTLAPNKALRTAAKNFQSKVAEEKSVAVARGFVPSAVFPKRPTHPPPTVTAHPPPSVTTHPPPSVTAHLPPTITTHTSVTPTQAILSSMGITNETSSTPTTSATVTPSQSTPTQAAVTTTTKAVGTAVAVSSQVLRSEAADETDGGTTDGGATTAEERTVDAKPAADSETTASKGGDSASQEDAETKPGAAESKTDDPPKPPTSSSSTDKEPTVPQSTLSVPGTHRSRSRSPSPLPRSVSPGSSPKREGRLKPNMPILPQAPLPPTILPPTILPPPILPPTLLSASGITLGAGQLQTTGLRSTTGLPAIAPPQSSSKLERLAAELILSSATAAAKKSSPPPAPPLSAEEFYRQQQILQRLNMAKKRKSVSVSSGSYSRSSRSHSQSPTSSDPIAYHSWSGSRSRSRSRSRSHSRSYSRSRSRSRSYSPYHYSQRSRQRSRKRKEKEREREREKEKEREKERERRSRHHKRKRRRHGSPETHSSEGYSKRSKRTRHREEISPEESLSVELSAPPSETEYGSSHRHKHKKRSKRKHRHREEVVEVQRSETDGEQEGDFETERQLEEDKLVGEVRGRERVDAVDSEKEGETMDAEEACLMADEGAVRQQTSEDGGQQTESEQQEAREHVPTPDLKQAESSDGDTEEVELAAKKPKISLVPYQDSSATEVEQPGDTPGVGSGIETAAAGQNQSTTCNVPNSVPSPVTGAESPLVDDCMDEITLHVEETIEGAGADVDAECPSQDGGDDREEGEIVESEDEAVQTPEKAGESEREETTDFSPDSAPQPSLPQERVKSLASAVSAVRSNRSDIDSEGAVEASTSKHSHTKQKHKHKSKDHERLAERERRKREKLERKLREIEKLEKKLKERKKLLELKEREKLLELKEREKLLELKEKEKLLVREKSKKKPKHKKSSRTGRSHH